MSLSSRAKTFKFCNFPIVIKNCPKSLKFFVQFYRVFGFSFSGVQFEEDGKHFSKKVAKIKGALLLLVNAFCIFCSLAMLAVNIVFSFSLTKAKSRGQLITGISAAESNTTTTAITADSSSTSPVTTSNLILYELTYGLEEFLDSFTHFKPVLQMILQSIVYIFLTDYLLVHPFSLLCGGRIVRDIAAVPLIREVDTSKWFLLRVILFSSGLHLIQSTIGFCVFNGRHLSKL